MASGRMEFQSEALMQHTYFSFVMPNDVNLIEIREKHHYEREPVNLILLHGYVGTDTDWMICGNAHEIAKRYNLNIFMPTTGNSFYLDKGYPGANFATFVGEELPDYISRTFGIRMNRENTIVGGLSMGGYGALHTALTYPERYSACIALSSALLIRQIASGDEGGALFLTPPPMLRDLFGDPDKLPGSDKDPEAWYKAIKASGKPIPKIYMAVGTEDFLLKNNHEYRDFLRAEGTDLIYEEGPGEHNWIFWNEYLERALRELL